MLTSVKDTRTVDCVNQSGRDDCFSGRFVFGDCSAADALSGFLMVCRHDGPVGSSAMARRPVGLRLEYGAGPGKVVL
jgi:hypothetical protein